MVEAGGIVKKQPAPAPLARNVSQATEVKQWLQEGGGINGQPPMLNVNHLPYERPRAALLAHLQKVNPNA